MKITYQITKLLTGEVWSQELTRIQENKELLKIFNLMTHSRMHLKTFIANCESKQVVNGFQFSYKEEK